MNRTSHPLLRTGLIAITIAGAFLAGTCCRHIPPSTKTKDKTGSSQPAAAKPRGPARAKALPRIRLQARGMVIALPGQSSSIERFAAKELQKHLLLITGVKPRIMNADNVTPKDFALHVGTRAPGDRKPLAREEARYTITREGAWIYGEDKIQRKSGSDTAEVLNMKFNRAGTLFAVYAFLENEFGVRWIEPGDRGIVYRKQPAPELTQRKYSWIPRLRMRHLRSNSWQWRRVQTWQTDAPAGCRVSREEAASRDLDEKIWLRRMRMGGSIVLNYGHAFTRWWKRYGKEHPEWFAMSPQGRRGPWANGHKPDRVKMCVSNPDLVKAVVKCWLKARAADPVAYETINVCENDSRGYCRCKACMRLDARKPGEAFLDHLTDRYIHFANAVLTEARQHVPDARAVMYAYSDYKLPPRRERVLPGLVLGFVPTGSMSGIERMYQGWRAAGAREMFLRPNDMHMDMGLPSGFDQDMFAKFKLGIKYGIMGTDYDSLHSFWPVSGLGDYALARGHIDPDRSFGHWEDEYCSAFGAAADQVKAYYRYWRALRKERILPHSREIIEKGRYGNFRRGLFWLLDKFYQEADFDKTDTLLHRGLAENPAPMARERLQRLILANQHARLMFRAIEGSNRAKSNLGRNADAAMEKLRRTRALINFRRRHMNDISIAWPRLFNIERTFGDLTGILWAQCFRDADPVRALPVYWHFRMDRQDSGVKEKWGGLSWDRLKTWDRIRTDRFWEKQVKVTKSLAAALADYDGIGWYATSISTRDLPALTNRQVLLTFGAVDESCWIYVNGRLAGKHIFTNPDDWKTPFQIRIDQAFDKTAKRQVIVVRVQDKAGAGGIWKRVWICRGKPLTRANP